jgi:hypothetical protein
MRRLPVLSDSTDTSSDPTPRSASSELAPHPTSARDDQEPAFFVCFSASFHRDSGNIAALAAVPFVPGQVAGAVVPRVFYAAVDHKSAGSANDFSLYSPPGTHLGRRRKSRSHGRARSMSRSSSAGPALLVAPGPGPGSKDDVDLYQHVSKRSGPRQLEDVLHELLGWLACRHAVAHASLPRRLRLVSALPAWRLARQLLDRCSRDMHALIEHQCVELVDATTLLGGAFDAMDVGVPPVGHVQHLYAALAALGDTAGTGVLGSQCEPKCANDATTGNAMHTVQLLYRAMARVRPPHVLADRLGRTGLARPLADWMRAVRDARARIPLNADRIVTHMAEVGLRADVAEQLRSGGGPPLAELATTMDRRGQCAVEDALRMARFEPDVADRLMDCIHYLVLHRTSPRGQPVSPRVHR